MSSETVSDIGEFGLIERLRAALPEAVASDSALSVGIGDDAAVWQPDGANSLVISTDSLVEGVHFRLDPGWSSWADVGHKALAVNLSDLAAMGAGARLAVVTLALRGSELVSDLVACYRALGELAARWECLVVGGDIVSSPVVSFHVTVIGQSRDGRVLTRDGARPGDVIGVSGTLGASAAGLALMRDGPEGPRANAATAELLMDAHRRPQPRLSLGQQLLSEGATAAMDVSDGLLGDLPKILVASGVAAEVDLVDLPVAAAVRGLFPDEWQDLALRGGEDFELLFTAPGDVFGKIARAAAATGTTVSTIGRIISPEDTTPLLRLRDEHGAVTAVQAGAFDHFR
jgi:thiamine-monophosphate kinase